MNPRQTHFKKILVGGLIVGGLAIVLYGGYYLNTKNRSSENSIENQAKPLQDTSFAQPALDSMNLIDSAAKESVVTTAPGTYKFILETTTNKKRALRRYNQLKSYMLDIRMDTQDSTSFKLYFVLPASPADTIRIKDSLNDYYGARVKIEY